MKPSRSSIITLASIITATVWSTVVACNYQQHIQGMNCNRLNTILSITGIFISQWLVISATIYSLMLCIPSKLFPRK